MAKDDDDTQQPKGDAPEAFDDSSEAEESEAMEATAAADAPAGASAEATEDEAHAAGALGAARYVHAAFFVAAILAAYLSSKLIVLAWGSIAEWPAAVRAVPQLVAYAEEEREGIALGAGAVIGTLGVVQSYRKEKVRGWADDVANELSRVTWPTREAVVNGTIVVVVASTIATIYVAIMDRFWSFITTLVYGA
jgi:preprotein translocase subunit SecE